MTTWVFQVSVYEPIRFYESAPRASLTEMYVALMAGAVITAGTGFTVVIDGLRHLPRRTRKAVRPFRTP